MAFIVEDGTNIPNANAYCTTAFATAYHADMGNTAWAALTLLQQQSNLIQATQYMVGFYRMKWTGLRVSPTQSLDWPRLGVILKDTASFFVDQRLSYTVPANIVPVVIQQACSELALRASTQDLWPDLDPRTLVEKVGPIQVNYDRFSPQFRRFRQIDLLLNPYLDATNGLTVRINRA